MTSSSSWTNSKTSHTHKHKGCLLISVILFLFSWFSWGLFSVKKIYVSYLEECVSYPKIPKWKRSSHQHLRSLMPFFHAFLLSSLCWFLSLYAGFFFFSFISFYLSMYQRIWKREKGKTRSNLGNRQFSSVFDRFTGFFFGFLDEWFLALIGPDVGPFPGPISWTGPVRF